MSLADCFARAANMGVITRLEAMELTSRYERVMAEAVDASAARAQMAMEIEAEAAHRKRAALLSEAARSRIFTALNGYTNTAGQRDRAEAFLAMHENMGDIGSFIQDAQSKYETIVRQAQAQMSVALKEFRKGAITGDRRRQGAWVGDTRVMARMDNVVKELFGENTGDPVAKMIAGAWTNVSNQLRERFNGAGGVIGMLEKWGMPQAHSQDALLSVGREGWVKYMMGDGVLDRDRMVHPLSKKKLSDADLKEALEVAWGRIVTDGMIDREIELNGAGGGKPALYKQHSDHRFLHFKNADAWLAYQKAYGAPDMFATMMGHINTMARDIAHMEVFGPNPNQMREFIKATLRKDATNMRSKSAVWAEQSARIKTLLGQFTNDVRSGEEKIKKQINDTIERINMIHAELETSRRTFIPGAKPDRATAKHIEDMSASLVKEHEILRKLNEDVQRLDLFMHDDPIVESAARDEYVRLVEEATEPVGVVDGMRPDDAANYLNRKIDRADAMWQEMRGYTVVDRKMARRMSTARSIVSSALLGAAWLTSLSDPAFGQDMRLRFGMGIAQSGAWRLMAATLKDMITRGTRDDAIAAGLGLESAMNVMHQQARMIGSIDMRTWSGFMADRVLSIGLLNPWTQAGKHLAGLDIMRFMGKLAGTKFEDLPASTQKALAKHGFKSAEWNAVRAADLHAGHLRPNEIEARAGRDLAERYLAMVLKETKHAVPESTVESRSVVTKQAAGTITGEMIRSMGQFKGFAISVLLLHARRVHRELQGGDRSAIGFATSLLITGTILGAFAMALKDMKDGRDPRKWLDEKTFLDPRMWGAALLQSGGLGIFGDLLFSEVNRFGGGLASTAMGPLAGRTSNILDMVAMPFEAASGKKVNPGRQAVRIAKDWTPGQNLWQANLIPYVAPRVLFDQLQTLLDPDAKRAFRDAETKRLRDYNQRYFWPPGASTPKRAPDLTRIFATR